MNKNKNKDAGNPFAPVFLPEFGIEVSWAMCRNPACPHFGVHYEGPPPGSSKSVSDERYRIETKDAKFKCEYCGQTFSLKSNRAIRAPARYFLQLSLPFADCPDKDCENHGVNVFERWYAQKGLRPYRRQVEHRVLCKSCGESFNTGEALQLRRTGKVKEEMREVILGVVESLHTVSSGIDRTKLLISSYYSRLSSGGARLRDWQSWRNARLLHWSFEKRQEPLAVYTDTFKVSVQKAGVAKRYHILNIIATVLNLDGTWFILAMHPYFLPEKRCPDWTLLMQEMGKPSFLAEWDCLQYSFGKKASVSVDSFIRSLSDVGREGYFMKPQYAEAAHFLVVRKMLSRFSRLHLYIDGSRSQFPAALTIFADDIRRKRVEIVLFQHQTPKRKGTGVYRQPIKPPDTAWNDMQARFAEQMGSASAEGGGSSDDRKKMAEEFRKAFQGAHSKPGKWAWLKYPPHTEQYQNPRSLWLTWSPDKQYEEIGRDLLWAAHLDPVDSSINWARARTNSLQRGRVRAKPGRSYKWAYVSPEVVMQEVWMTTTWRNYGVRVKSEKKIPPARPMGLMTPKESSPDLAALAWDFRLGLKHAERMTKWLTR